MIPFDHLQHLDQRDTQKLLGNFLGSVGKTRFS